MLESDIACVEGAHSAGGHLNHMDLNLSQALNSRLSERILLCYVKCYISSWPKTIVHQLSGQQDPVWRQAESISLLRNECDMDLDTLGPVDGEFCNRST